MADDLDNQRHGTYSDYSGQRCRCESCRAASAAYQRERRQRMKRSGALGEHGLASTYSNGCRCVACTKARKRWIGTQRGE